MSEDVWEQKTAAQRKNILSKCQRATVKNAPQTVTSSDGNCVVLPAPLRGQKPGQRKRKRAAKTTTISNKRIGC